MSVRCTCVCVLGVPVMFVGRAADNHHENNVNSKQQVPECFISPQRAPFLTTTSTASRLKIAGELTIDLAGTSRRSMRDRCTIMIDANTDERDLTHQQPSN